MAAADVVAVELDRENSGAVAVGVAFDDGVAVGEAPPQLPSVVGEGRRSDGGEALVAGQIGVGVSMVTRSMVSWIVKSVMTSRVVAMTPLSLAAMKRKVSASTLPLTVPPVMTSRPVPPGRIRLPGPVDPRRLLALELVPGALAESTGLVAARRP